MFKILRWIFLGLLPCIVWVNASAQGVDVGNFSVQQFTNENGLPQNSINFIIEDKSGFIWMATEGGLVRFDGKNFRTYLAPNGKSQFSRFHHILAGSKNSLWVLSTDFEIVEIKNGSAGVRTSPISRAYLAAFNVLREEKGYASLGQSKFVMPQYNKSVRILINDTSSFYRKNDEGITYYLNGQKKFSIPHPENVYINYFIFNGYLYGHVRENIFYVLDTATKKFKEIVAENLPHSSELPFIYWQSVNGFTYYYIDHKLYQLERKRDGGINANLILEGFDLNKNNIVSVYYNKSSGNLFLGSATEGFFYLRKHRFNVLRLGNEKRNDVFYTHDYYKDNSVITPQGYIIKKDGEKQKWIDDKKYKLDRYSILKSRFGRKSVWTKVDTWLCEFSTEGKLLNKWDFHEEVYQLHETSDSILWMACRWGKIYKLNLGIKNDNPHYVTYVPKPTYLRQLVPNQLWVGSENGIYRVDMVSGKAKLIQVADSMFVRSIYTNNPSQLWVTAIDYGLLLYRNNKLTTFPLDEHDYLRDAHCIVEDKFANFWVPTNQGLIRVKKQDLLDYADGKNNRVFYFYYGKESGFATNEFNGGCQPCGVNWPDGTISLPSLDGLVVFDPQTLKPILPNSEIFVDQIVVDETSVDICDTLFLENNFQRVSMYFATPYMDNYKNLKLEVSIQDGPKEKLWHTLGHEQSFSFNTLPFGTYHLKVRQPFGSNRRDYITKVIVVVVKAAFWQTWWFITLCGVLFFFVLYFGIRFRLRYITKKNLELERLISERTQDLSETVHALRKSEEQLSSKSNLQQKIILAFTHDLKSPLMYLMLTGQKLYEDIDIAPRKMVDNVKMVYDSSFSIYHSMDNFLNYAKIYFIKDNMAKSVFSIHELAQEKIEIFKLIAESKNVGIKNNINPQLKIKSNPVVLSIVLHNLLDNAIKYTDEGTVTLSSKSYGEKMAICITDTGCGMDKEEIREYTDFFDDKAPLHQSTDYATRGLGLQIVKEMMDMLGGKIEMKSELDKGTSIKLIFTTHDQ